MSKHNKHEEKIKATTGQPGDILPDEDVVDSAIAAEITALHEELNKALERNEELLQLRMREQAEFENFKKRRLAEQERHEKMALRSLMMDLVEVDSNFQLALSGGEADFEAYKKGVKMIAGQLSTVLNRNGVSRIDALNQPFDHDLHEAMLQVDEGEHEGMKVIEVMREGYMIHDQVLRLAGVKVARGSGVVEDVPEEIESGTE